MIKRFCSNTYINLKKDYGIYLYPLYAEIDNLLLLILQIVFISIHTHEFIWMVLLHTYSVKSSLRFLTCSPLSFRSYIYWTHLWIEFHLENRFYLHHIISNIIYVSFYFCDQLSCRVKIAVSFQRKRLLISRWVRNKEPFVSPDYVTKRSNYSLDSSYTIMGTGK